MKRIVLLLFLLNVSISLAQVITKSSGTQPKEILTADTYNAKIEAICKSNNANMVYELAAVFSDLDRLQKIEAETYALLHNIPKRIYHENGSFSELMRLSEYGLPVYYQLDNVDAAVSSRANFLNTGGGLGLNLNGDGMIVHVWDGGPTRPTHQEFDGAGGNNRVSIIDGVTSLNGNSFHAQHVTGTIVASGFSPNAKGMSWQADARTSEWTSDLSEATTAAAGGMILSNHSYGNNITFVTDAQFGQYGTAARNWDALMYSQQNYLMVKSAGNDGNDNSSNGAPLGGNSSFDKLSGNATAKNNLVIANATDASVNSTTGALISVSRNSSSSEGPTDDYRIKPDIAGNGTGLYSCYDNSNSAYNTISGTSMAAPNVTGTLLLLQEHYQDLHGSTMRAASLKGLALHTADDMSPNGPDALTGWGLLNAKKAAETISDADTGFAVLDERTLTNGSTYQITIQSNGVDPLMASISWTDPAGTANGGLNSPTPALVNDLDLRLDNGTTYTPWRLTGVNTNGTGDNVVDPFERIDIAGASGTYTLTVSHKGTLSASQNYTLIVTGGTIAAATPVIAYSSITGSTTENSDCNFTDLNIELNIGTAPSANADVTFSVNGTSTATNGVDFQVLTPSLTFPSGSNAPQNMVLRVYHDGFVEGNETAVIDFTVNPNGGDATANPVADTFTFTINDDDIVPNANILTNVLTEDFEDSTGWTVIDNDGDTENWGIFNPYAHGNLSGFWAGSVTDQAVTGGSGVLTPDNFFSSPVFSIPATATNTRFTYEIGDFGTPEHYAVYFSTSKNTAAAIIAGTLVEETNTVGNNTTLRTIDLTTLAGQTGYLSFRHFSTSGNSLLMLDTVDVVVTEGTEVQSAVNSGTPDELNINGTGTAYASDPGTGNIMAGITNNNSFDYGCVDVSVSRAGTGAQSYNGSTLPNHVTDKTFDFSPENTTGSGSTSLTFYFTQAEINGWIAATGLTVNDLVAARGNASSFVEVVSITSGTFGTNTTLSGNFTGLDGTFYFGPAAAFVACPGVTKTWNGSSWSPSGAPGSNDTVIINGAYDTNSDGDLNACTLTINSSRTLTVNGGGLLHIDGDITVDGTLIVEHQGIVVQTDPLASVTNNGTINVQLTTPVLQNRDFMVMGSPMSGETRNGVFTNAFLVLNHDPSNFIPHPGVPAGGTNFADNNGDLWTTYNGAINVGEGYIVRPQSGYTDPANTTYDMTYSLGTLNNGDVSRDIVYNGAGANPDGTPNALANPYASPISADALISGNSVIDRVYFWEHLTPPSTSIPGYGSLNFSMDDISMYITGGALPAANDPGTSTEPNGVISTGQGFAIKAFAGGPGNEVVFTNAMRLTSGNNTLRTPQHDVEKVMLKVRNDAFNLGSHALVAFNPLATEGMDENYDADRLATTISIYSHLDDGTEQLGIQSRGVFNATTKIPIGFASQVEANATYTISIASIEGEILPNATIYLVDNWENTITDLGAGNYEFTSGKGTFNNRFTLQFVYETLGVTPNKLDLISIYPNPTQNIVNIVSPQVEITSVEVYDVRGRKVEQVSYNSSTNYQLDLSKLDSALYFIKINSIEDSVIKRIIKR